LAFTPFLSHHIASGRTYYGPALQANGNDQGHLWTTGDQRPVQPTSSSAWNVFKFGAVLGGLAGAGFIRTKNGNVWDKYLSGIRAAEEYSPGGVLRTLQVSNMLSPYASNVRDANLFVSPGLLSKNTVYRDYLTKVMGGGGDTFMRLGIEGVSLRGQKLYWGQGSEVALKYATALTSTGHGAAQRIGAGYARMLNTSGKVPFEHFFATANPSDDVFNPLIGDLPAQIIGGQTRASALYRRAGSIGTEMVERFNRLLKTPFENQFLKDTIGKHLDLGVKQSGGLRMLGRLGVKYGAALGGVVLGYQSLDYMMKNSSLTDGTIFEEGLTTGLGTALVKFNLARASTAEALGLHDYREKQEEIAPGSTNLTKLMAFPLMGAVGMGFSAYGVKVHEMYKMQREARLAGKPMAAAAAREAVEKQMGEWSGKGVVARFGKYMTSARGVGSRQDLLGKMVRAVSRSNEAGDLIFKGLGKIGPVKLASMIGVGVGLAAVAPFLPGALIPGERPDELRALYSGDKEVAVRKGRWWSFGRTPYEGNRIMYFRPHWYARMRQDSRDKAIWGDEDLTPVEKWYKREFTYDLEEKHYHNRPYPVTSLPFEDIPLIGPLLANTIGRFIKPPKLMHTEEWKGPEGSTKADYPKFGARYAMELGEMPGGAPISPYDPSQVAGEQIYRMSEMVGLPGFLGSAMKEKLTGSQDWFDQYKQLESARRIDGMERWYWDQELGDMFMTNEALRRLYPHRRRQIDLYNPIRNTMPEWLPGSGDKAPDFLHGDPYTKVQEGELRLPGKGYEARYPELEGLNPEDYPLIHQFRILGDVAPYSDRFGESLGAVRVKRNSGDWTEGEEQMYQTVLDQTKQRKSGEEFHEYQYLSPMGDVFSNEQTGAEQSALDIALANERAKNKEQPGMFKRVFGGYWEALSHNAETSLDMLTPIAPGAKLVHMRTPIEAYEREQVYGSESGFWQHPIRDFILPFGRTLANSFGYRGIPDRLEEKRELEEYFDVLKYVKYSKLANVAQHSQDFEAFQEFERKKDQTLFGINPFTRSYENLMRALPKRDRDYFTRFEKAETEEERQRILELVPENERSLYIARWKLGHADEIRRAKKMGILGTEELTEANEQLANFYDESENEGLPNSKDLFAEYLANRNNGESYPDWYRRTYLLPKYKIPGADWVGWHPSVDMDDVKLKVVQTLGEDMHDYDLWESRAKTLPYKAYVDEDAIAPIVQDEGLSKEEMRTRINDILSTDGMDIDAFLTSVKKPVRQDEINVEVENDRSEELRAAMLKMA
jgi:hypothetical protein